MTFTLDSTLADLLNNPQAKAILEKYAPGVSTNMMVGMVKGQSLKSLLAMPQAAQLGITQEKVETVLAEINKLIQ